MNGLARFVVLALSGLLLVTSRGRAEVLVQSPAGTVVAGPAAPPGAPGFRIRILGRLDLQIRLAPRPAPQAVARPTVPPPSIQSAQATATGERPQTLREFAAQFQPAAGFYEVLLIHPDTREPVYAHFTLPEGQPRRVRVFPRQILFDYGNSWVKLQFEPRGGVRVDYR